MNTDEIIEQICSFYDFELINYFFDERYDFFDPNETLSSDKFKELMKKYDISIEKLAEEFHNIYEYSGLSKEDCKIQIQGIGTTYKKPSKNKSSLANTENKEYTKSPLFLHRKSLLNLIYTKIKGPSTLKYSIKFSQMYSGIVFLQENKFIEPNVIGFSTKEGLQKILKSMEISDLLKLLDRLQYPSENNTEEYDIYSKFLDSASVYNLLLLKDIFNMDSPKHLCSIFDIIYTLTFYINNYTIEQQFFFLDKLKKRRRLKESSPITEKLINQYYPTKVVTDEWILRYRDIPEYLQNYIDDYDIIPMTFLNMTPLIWEIIQYIFKTFKNPCGKNVENFFQKCIEQKQANI